MSVVLGLTLLAVALSPRNAAALTGLLAAAAAPLVLAALRPRLGPRPERDSAWALGAFAVAAVVLSLAALRAADVRVSLFGLLGQHSGALLWLSLAVLVGSVALRSRPGDAGRVARAVGVSGAVMGVAGLLDFAGLFHDLRAAESAAGILENSNSFTQALVVALGCAVAWAIGRRGIERAVASGCAVLCVGGLAAGNTDAAWVGLVLGIAVAGVAIVVARARRPRPAWLAAGGTAASAAVLGGTWVWLARGAGIVPEWVEVASNERTTIWASALAQAARHLLTGRGPEQFTCWVQWSSNPGVDLSFVGTGDPHNVMLYWLLGAGVPGLAVFSAALYLGLRALFGVVTVARHRLALAAMVAGVLAWGVAIMFSWTGPLGGILAAVVTGALLGRMPAKVAAAPRSGPGVVANAGIAAFATIAIAVVAWSWGVVPAEYVRAWGLGLGTADPAALATVARATGDPSFASLAVRQLMAGATARPAEAASLQEAALGLVPALTRAATWNVDAAMDLHDSALARGPAAGAAKWSDAEAALATGQQADPASGLWEYLGAVDARAIGREPAAREHARRALRFPQSAEVRAWLETVAGGTP